MKKLIIVLLSGLFLLCVQSLSWATIINYDFHDGTHADDGIVDELNVTSDGVTLNVTAWTIDEVTTSLTQLTDPGNTDSAGVRAKWLTSGLGVKSYSGDGEDIDGGNSDPFDLDEGLLFSFSHVVELTFINFGNWSTSSDDFNLNIDGISVLTDKSLTTDKWTTDSTYIGMEFLIWADSDSDAFKVQEIAVSPVPEPATVTLLGIGLVGLAAAAVRRRLKGRRK